MRRTADNCTSIKKKERFLDSIPRLTHVVHLRHLNADNNSAEHMKAETQRLQLNVRKNIFVEWQKEKEIMEVYLVNIT